MALVAVPAHRATLDPAVTESVTQASESSQNSEMKAIVMNSQNLERHSYMCLKESRAIPEGRRYKGSTPTWSEEDTGSIEKPRSSDGRESRSHVAIQTARRLWKE